MHIKNIRVNDIFLCGEKEVEISSIKWDGEEAKISLSEKAKINRGSLLKPVLLKGDIVAYEGLPYKVVHHSADVEIQSCDGGEVILVEALRLKRLCLAEYVPHIGDIIDHGGIRSLVTSEVDWNTYEEVSGSFSVKRSVGRMACVRNISYRKEEDHDDVMKVTGIMEDYLKKYGHFTIEDLRIKNEFIEKVLDLKNDMGFGEYMSLIHRAGVNMCVRDDDVSYVMYTDACGGRYPLFFVGKLLGEQF